MNFPFNIIDSVRAGYEFIFRERAYLLRLALVPVLIKLVCFIAAISLGVEGNMVRMAIVMLPASLAEGWMLAHVIRLITLGQRWPFQPTGDMEADMSVLRTRMHGVMGGLVTYALINLLLAGLLALMMGMAPQAADAGVPQTVDAGRALLMLVIMGAVIWAFPLLWVFVPLSLSMDGRAWLQEVRGLRFSLPMIAVWVLCFLPVTAIAMLGISAIISPFPPDAIPAGARFSSIILSVILDTAKALIGTAGITFALGEYFANKGSRETA